MTPTEPRERRRTSRWGLGCILYFCVLGLLGCIGAVLLIRWMNQPGNTARAAAIIASWSEPDEEIVDMDDPRGVVIRNRSNGDITITGSRIEDIPKWIPILPGTRIARPFSIICNAQKPDRDSYIDGRFELTGGSTAKNAVYEYYKTELVRQGFEVENDPPPYLEIGTPEGLRKYLLVRVRGRKILLEYTEWLKMGAEGSGVAKE